LVYHIFNKAKKVGVFAGDISILARIQIGWNTNLDR